MVAKAFNLYSVSRADGIFMQFACHRECPGQRFMPYLIYITLKSANGTSGTLLWMMAVTHSYLLHHRATYIMSIP